VSCVKIS